jgi:hypothetical protein
MAGIVGHELQMGHKRGVRRLLHRLARQRGRVVGACGLSPRVSSLCERWRPGRAHMDKLHTAQDEAIGRLVLGAAVNEMQVVPR